ncbi:MAG TPA: hypothetical protein VLH80_07350 [Nitrospiraceae bacterium]|nr:hypothetical protein [Nitrospiraceae bacterium]
MTWSIGDRVEYQSMSSTYMFRGVIEGFFGKDRQMALCTDQTGRGSRPVNIRRLKRATLGMYSTGQVA